MTIAHINHQIERINYDDNAVELLRRTLASDLSQNELQLLVRVAESKQLDLFAKQLYGIKRGGKMTIQTGIDGFRLIAERTGKYAGQGPKQWCGEDGIWRDVWLDKKPPVAARATVLKYGRNNDVQSFTITAHWDEFADNNGPMWKKMPRNQLAKCAEAQALRMAFPEDLSGIYTDDEMDQAGVIDTNTVEPLARSGVSESSPAEPTYDVTGDIAQLDQDARKELSVWWKATLPGGVKAGAVPTHFIEAVRAKITELKGPDDDNDPEPGKSDNNDVDDVVDAEIVEDEVEPGLGSAPRTVSTVPPMQARTASTPEDAERLAVESRFIVPPPPPATSTAGGVRDGKVMHSGKDVLTAVCREQSISPPERNAAASSLFGRKITRITELTDNQCHDLARYLEDDTFAANRQKEAQAAQRISDAFGATEEEAS